VRYLHCKFLGRESFTAGRGGPLLALRAFREWWGRAAHALTVSTGWMCRLYGSVTTVISVLYERCIAVCVPSENVPWNVCRCAKHRRIRFWHNRIHCDVTEVVAVGFLLPLNRRHCSSAPGLRRHSHMPGVFRTAWETGMRSTQCLFWHFILTYLCLHICICRHICSFFPTFLAITVLSHMVVCQHIPTLAPGEEQQSS
jgi:hypothetical protein